MEEIFIQKEGQIYFNLFRADSIINNKLNTERQWIKTEFLFSIQH